MSPFLFLKRRLHNHLLSQSKFSTFLDNQNNGGHCPKASRPPFAYFIQLFKQVCYSSFIRTQLLGQNSQSHPLPLHLVGPKLEPSLAPISVPCNHNQHQPVIPKKVRGSFTVVGPGVLQIASFRSFPSCLCPLEITNPRYITSFFRIWAFCNETR